MPGVGFHFLSGADLDVESSLKKGVLTFEYDLRDRPLDFFGIENNPAAPKHLGAAFPRSIAYIKQDILEERIKMYQDIFKTSEVRDLNEEEKFKEAMQVLSERLNFYNILKNQTLNEEVKHLRQYGFAAKTIDSFEEKPLWVRFPIKIPGINKEIEFPAIEAIFMGFNLLIPEEDLRPLEFRPGLERRLKKSNKKNFSISIGIEGAENYTNKALILFHNT